jgi:hypothetical protein
MTQGARSLHDYRAESAEDVALCPGGRGRWLRSQPSFPFRDELHYRFRAAEMSRLASLAVTPAVLSSG